MKLFFPHSLFFALAIVSYSLNAQNTPNQLEEANQLYIDRSPLYDYTEAKLNAIDSIPDFQSKQNKLKITGTIFKSDGTTPAKDVILYIEQADEDGDFDLRKHENKRYVHHRGWIKTGVDGRYTFYTFIPGSDKRYNQLQQIFPIIKEDSKTEYILESFLFNDDDLLSKLCRKRLAKKGDVSRILKPKLNKDILVVTKNIVLEEAKQSI